MTALRTHFLSLSPQAFWQWGRLVLGGSLALGLLIVLLLAWQAPEVLPFFPVVLLGAVALWQLFRHPLLNLCVVLGSYVIIADYTEGLQVQEVLYGLYYLAFLGYWFLTKVFFYRENPAVHSEGKALLMLLVYATASIGLTFVFRGDLNWFRGEWLALTMLGFYFPIREACARDPRAVRALVGIACWLVVFTALRNFINYREIILEATYIWQVATGRTALNELFLMCGALGAVVGLLYAKRWVPRLLLFVLFVLAFAGLILTQSRGYWAAFLLGTLVLFILTDRKKRGQILLLFGGGLAGFTVVGLLLVPEFMGLIYLGVVDRFASLGTAATDDLSLVNRFKETGAVWEYILRNPIIGYGLGVPYSFYDMTWEATRVDFFIHNGYVAMWYKFGLFGLGLVLFFWVRAIGRAYQLFHSLRAAPLERLMGLVAAVFLVAEALVANTSNPFAMGDGNLTFALLAGLAAGTWERAQRAPQGTPPQTP